MLNIPNSSKTSQALSQIQLSGKCGVTGQSNHGFISSSCRGLSEITIFKRILKFTECCFSQRLAGLSLVLTFLLVLPLIMGLSTPVFITTPVLMMSACVFMFLSGLISFSVRSWFRLQMKSMESDPNAASSDTLSLCIKTFICLIMVVFPCKFYL